MTERTLDRLVHFDPRSRDYPIRTLLTTLEPRSYSWRVNTTLDQGVEGACVGFAWAHEMAARPVELPVSDDMARQIYRHAQTVDPWPGTDYEGTSVLAGAKILQRNGVMENYRWAFGLRDTLATISRHGPVVLGLDWHTGMFDTDEHGFIHASGRVVGGHAICAVGVNVKGRYVTVHNSWGPEWGVNGKARISWDDLERLLHADGEACVPVGRTKAATA